MENRPKVMYGSIYIEKIVFPKRPAIPQRLQDELPLDELKDLYERNTNDYNNTVQIIAKEVKKGLSGMKIDYFVGKHINNIDMSHSDQSTTTTTTTSDSYNTKINKEVAASKEEFNKATSKELERILEEIKKYNDKLGVLEGEIDKFKNFVITRTAIDNVMESPIKAFESKERANSILESEAEEAITKSLLVNFRCGYGNGTLFQDIGKLLKIHGKTEDEIKDSPELEEILLKESKEHNDEILSNQKVQTAFGRVAGRMYNNDSRKTTKHADKLHNPTKLLGDYVKSYKDPSVKSTDDNAINKTAEFVYSYITPECYFNKDDKRIEVPFGITMDLPRRTKEENPGYVGNRKGYNSKIKDEKLDNKAHLFNNSTFPGYIINVGEKELKKDTESIIKNKLKCIEPSVVNYNSGGIIGFLVNKKLLSFTSSCTFNKVYPDLKYNALEGCCGDGPNAWFSFYAFAVECMQFERNNFGDFANLPKYNKLMTAFEDHKYLKCKSFESLINKICDSLVTKEPVTTFISYAIYTTGEYKNWTFDYKEKKDLKTIQNMYKSLTNDLLIIITLPYLNEINLIEDEFKILCPEYSLGDNENYAEKAFVIYLLFNRFLLEMKNKIISIYKKGDWTHYDNYTDEYIKHIKEEKLNVNITPSFHSEFDESKNQRERTLTQREGFKLCSLVSIYIGKTGKNEPLYGYNKNTLPYSKEFAEVLEKYIETTDVFIKKLLAKEMMSIYKRWQEEVHATSTISKNTVHERFWAYPKIYDIVYTHPELYDDEHLGSMLNVYKTSKLAKFEPNWDDLIYYIKIYEFDKKSTLDREENRFQELYGFRL